MQKFASVNDALDFAIQEEIKANEFYTRLGAEASGSGMRKVFEQFAAEELAHRHKLEQVKAGKTLLSAHRKITELSVTDYLVSRESSPVTSYQDALLLAMQKEKAAYRMYSDLAASVGGGEMEALFHSLAQEEANHKLRFELEYDTFVTPDN
jgi:rubrerythrin